MLNHALLLMGDLLFGWAARLSFDLAVVIIALISAALLVVIRAFTTDQNLLARCQNDQRRIKQLLRENKPRQDQAERHRLRQLKAVVSLKQLRAEVRPMLWALLPVALLGTWAWQRLEYQGLKPRQAIEFTATFPLGSAGKLTFLTPPPGLQSETGWIREIKPDENGRSAWAHASWTLTATNQTHAPLALRVGEETFPHWLVVDGWRYAAPTIQHGDREIITKVALKRYHAFGLIPNVPGVLPSWLTAYFLIALLAVSACKRMFGVR